MLIRATTMGIREGRVSKITSKAVSIIRVIEKIVNLTTTIIKANRMRVEMRALISIHSPCNHNRSQLQMQSLLHICKHHKIPLFTPHQEINQLNIHKVN